MITKEIYLTKEIILERVTEEEIVRFLVPSYDSNIRKKNYQSIFSDKDDNPSMSIYRDSRTGKIKFKSFNTGHGGDVFQMFAYQYNIDCKIQFNKVLQTINDEMNLNITHETINTKSIKKTAKTIIKNNNTDFQISFFSSYTSLFLKFWKQFNVNEVILRKYNVKQTREFTLHRRDKKFNFNYEKLGTLNICYNINNKIKLYTPALPQGFDSLAFREQTKKFGFKNQRSQDIFGLKQLPKDNLEYIIITAGEKDCLIANARGFNAISLQSENQLPQDSLLKDLRTKAKHILVCYDNDQAGINAAKRINESFGTPFISLPDNINDIAEFFQKYENSNFQKLIEEVITNNHISKKSLNQGNTKLHIVENYLLNKYNFRYNIISQEHEISLKSKNKYEELNIDELSRELTKNKINLSLNGLHSLMRSKFCPEYNPIKNYFESLRIWKDTEEDYISKLASYVKTDKQQEWTIALKKWLVRAIKSVFEDDFYNKHALILVQTKQHTGKTSFCRFLCPKTLKNYITQNIKIQDKDGDIALGTNFIINLDELKEFSSKNMGPLKSMLSSTNIKIRLPYARKATTIKRICSFVGSTNNSQFLSDETGNTRWFCFSVNSINFDYNNIKTEKKEIDIDDVYAQAYSLYKQKFDCEPTQKEIEKFEKNNIKYKSANPNTELLLEYFEPTLSKQGKFFTSTQIANYIQDKTSLKVNPIMIGRSLIINGFEKKLERFKQNNISKKVHGYWVKIIK